MAPRRPKTALNGAAEFDFDSFLKEFERPQFTRNLYRKGKLVPRLSELGKELYELETRVDRLEKVSGDAEQDITGTDPLSELKQRLADRTEEWNAVAEEFNESAVPFTFRIPGDDDDHERIQGMMTLTQPEKPKPVDTGDKDADKAANEAQQKVFDRAFSEWWDQLTIRSMSVTCVSHTFDVEQWEKLRIRVGVVAFNALMEAWAEAVQAAKPAAPFLLKPSRTPVSEESSPASELL